MDQGSKATALCNWFYFLGNVPKKFPNLLTVYCNMRSSPHGNFMATIATSSQIITGLYWDINDIIHHISIAMDVLDVHGCPWPKIDQLPSTLKSPKPEKTTPRQLCHSVRQHHAGQKEHQSWPQMAAGFHGLCV